MRDGADRLFVKQAASYLSKRLPWLTLSSVRRLAGAAGCGFCSGLVPGIGMDGAQLAGPRKMLEGSGLLGMGATIAPRIGSLALRLAQVSDGRLAAAFAGGTSHDWDLAAADLLVHEAGGRMTTLKGDTLRYNRPQLVHDVLVAAGRERHAWLLSHFASDHAAH